jgi:hypothetical protein
LCYSNIVDNIPAIQTVGNTFYTSKLNIVTETGATVSINNAPIGGTAVAVTGIPVLCAIQ